MTAGPSDALIARLREQHCWQPDCDGHFHMCPNCRGSGLAKDQWYW